MLGEVDKNVAAAHSACAVCHPLALSFSHRPTHAGTYMPPDFSAGHKTSTESTRALMPQPRKYMKEMCFRFAHSRV